MYHDHPHRIIASANGWKVNPSRADFFSGKSSAVMQARSKEASAKMRTSNAHATIMRRIKTANEVLHGMNIDYDNSVGTTKNERFQKYMQSMLMDVVKTFDAQHGMGIDSDNSVGTTKNERFADEKAADKSGHIRSLRTPFCHDPFRQIGLWMWMTFARPMTQSMLDRCLQLGQNQP